MVDQADPRFEARVRDALRSAEWTTGLTSAGILARRDTGRLGATRRGKRVARAGLLAAAALLLVPLGALLVGGERPSVPPTPLPGVWTMTGQELIDRLSAEDGYAFGGSRDYPGDAWVGPPGATDDDVAYGGTGTVVVRAPFDERAHVLVKTSLASAAMAEGGCRYVWRMLDLLVPDATDQAAVWATLNGAIDEAPYRIDPSYALADVHQDVRGGAVNIEFVVVATVEDGAIIEDPAMYLGGIAFEFRPFGATAISTPPPDRAIPTMALVPSMSPAGLPDLSACSRPPEGRATAP